MHIQQERGSTLGMVASSRLYAKALWDLSSQENIWQGNLFAKCSKISSS